MWFVARTQPRREKWAAENVRRQGHECYLPLCELGNVIKPMFPSYLFVDSMTGQWHFLKGTFGVSGVVMTGNMPAILDYRVVAQLRAKENGFGHIELGDHYQKGDKVRIKSGPFIYHEGLFDRQDGNRVKVLLDLLGRKIEVEVHEKNAELVL
jgi:transcriptional antiterminator RfaH